MVSTLAKFLLQLQMMSDNSQTPFHRVCSCVFLHSQEIANVKFALSCDHLIAMINLTADIIKSYFVLFLSM